MSCQVGYALRIGVPLWFVLLLACEAVSPESAERGQSSAVFVPQGTASAHAITHDLQTRFRFEAEGHPSEPVLRDAAMPAFSASNGWLTPRAGGRMLRGVRHRGRVRLPPRADLSFEVADDTSGLSVAVRLDGAKAVEASLSGGFVVYPGAHPAGGHVVHRPTVEGTEDFVLFELEPPEPSVTYHLTLGEGVAGLRLVSRTLEILDADGTPRLRVAPPFLLDSDGRRHDAHLAVDGCAVDTDPAPPFGRRVVAPGGRGCALHVMWPEAEVAYPALLDPAWTTTGSMAEARSRHSASVLAGDRVLVVGGLNTENQILESAEIYDPESGTWAATGAMAEGRDAHSASVLDDGRVLVAGGGGNLGNATVEIYDPDAGTFSTAAEMATSRRSHTATVLEDGRVLVAGGTTSLDRHAEVYDAAGDTWVMTPVMSKRRWEHTATLLPDGRVLVAGGCSSHSCTSASTYFATAEIYDPLADDWSMTGTMGTSRRAHTATLLSDGTVIVAGGWKHQLQASAYASAEIYDPASEQWTEGAEMATARRDHTATVLLDGTILVLGGRTGAGGSAEIYCPDRARWQSTVGAIPRMEHTAPLLSGGHVLVVGGRDGAGRQASSTIYDPYLETWRLTEPLTHARRGHTATRLLDGRILVVGGQGDDNAPLAEAELFDPAVDTWADAGSMAEVRSGHSATLLLDGRVLIAGGRTQGRVLDTAEIYDPADGTFTETGVMTTVRLGPHTATRLADGRVLVAGGGRDSAEIYDPATEVWATTAKPAVKRSETVAAALTDGTVLIIGGDNPDELYSTYASVERFDPDTEAWTFAGALEVERRGPTANLLADGTVLVTGGWKPSTCFAGVCGGGALYASTERYDPAWDAWASAGSMNSGRRDHAVTLLSDGRVLAVGGYDGSTRLRSADIYDPSSGEWRPTAAMETPRQWHTATRLYDGRILVVGGHDGDGTLAAAELYELAAPVGTACSNPAECSSGFCVDGVCCDGPCGGGDPNDCQACSLAAGAPVDGRCSAITDTGHVCRPGSGDVCDPGATCDGVRPECPEDTVAAAGTVCRPASGPCDSEEVCTGVLGEPCPPSGYLEAGAAGDPSCAPYLCDGESPNCPEHCGGDGDCAEDHTCVDGACVAPGGEAEDGEGDADVPAAGCGCLTAGGGGGGAWLVFLGLVVLAGRSPPRRRPS